MATLTETATVSRKIIRYGIYSIMLIVMARYSILLGSRVYKSLFPPPPPPPQACWDKLPQINFPKRPVYDKVKFVLETANLTLPEIQPQANVYFIPKPFITIKSVERGKETAQKLGFNPEGRKLSDTVYLFEKQGKTPSTLTLNIVTNSFSVSYDLANDPNLVLGKASVPQTAINKAQNFLAKAGLLPTDVSTGTPETEFLKLEGNQFVGVISLSEADLIKVNLFRRNYKELPVKTPNPKQSNIWFIISNDILAGEYRHFDIDEGSGCTYSLKTAQDAWDDLNKGKGYIANFGNNQTDAIIKIRKIYLAYYDSGEYQEYLQPVIVFEGDNEFTAYVPAITYDFYSGDQAVTPTP